MFGNKKEKQPTSENTQQLIRGALSYEEDKERLYKRSNKIAWTIALISALVVPVTVGIGGYFIYNVVKEMSVPKLLGFDRSTGTMDYITVVDKDVIAELDGKDALDKFFVNNYINLRESYTSQTIQKTYDTTQLFSSDSVADQFREEYNLPDSLDKRLKENGTAMVKIISIVLERIGGENVATARIEIDEKDTQGIKTKKQYTVRLAYEYKPHIELNVSGRMENPVGFYVTSYQKVLENL